MNEKSTKRYVAMGPVCDEHEREVLVILMEECAEVIKVASKMLRFGKEDCEPGTNITNVTELGLEVGDLMTMVGMATNLKLMTRGDIAGGMIRKTEKLKKYMQTQQG
jgi:hypothetical protein